MYICPCYTVKTVDNFFSPFVAQALLATHKPNNRSILQPLHSTLICSARLHENCCVKFTVKKINVTILGPHRPVAPHIAGSAGSVVTPLVVAQFVCS